MAAVKLVPLGQTDGQRLLQRYGKALEAAVDLLGEPRVRQIAVTARNDDEAYANAGALYLITLTDTGASSCALHHCPGASSEKPSRRAS